MYQKGRLQSFWMDKGDAYDFEFTSEHSWAPLYTTPPAQPAPVQEPVGWFKYDKVSGCWHPQHDEFAPTHAVREGWKQLYTTPPAAPVVDCHATGVCIQSGLRAEMPAPVQEPVACVQDLDEVKRKHLVYEKGMDWKDPLYTTPPAAQRPWVGLTAGERDVLFTKHYQWDDYGKAIEAKLKEKNT
jgi:hypothetical protein